MATLKEMEDLVRKYYFRNKKRLKEAGKRKGDNSLSRRLIGVDYYREGPKNLRFLWDKKAPRPEVSMDEGQFDDFDSDDFDFPRERKKQPEPAEQDLPRTERLMNPIQPGISISHPGLGSGTLGAFVLRQDTGELAVLSCAHVLAGRFARIGDPIFQPGVSDSADSEFDTIGYLEDWFIDSGGDAAIAVLNHSRMLNAQLFGSQKIISKVAQVELGEVLTKSGRGSGITTGKVDGIGLYDLTLDGVRYEAVRGFRIVPYEGPTVSEPGDSGAIWYREKTGEGVGLHIDGDGRHADDPDDGGEEFGIACHLDVVLERLKVRLLTAEEVTKKRKVVLVPAELAERIASMKEAEVVQFTSLLNQAALKKKVDRARAVSAY